MKDDKKPATMADHLAHLRSVQASEDANNLERLDKLVALTHEFMQETDRVAATNGVPVEISTNKNFVQVQVPSRKQTVLIRVDGDDFYSVSLDDGSNYTPGPRTFAFEEVLRAMGLVR